MQLSDFNFELPAELIAQYPCKDRTGCRLLALDGNTGETRDLKFYNVIDFLEPGDLLVFNDTKVIPARIFGNKETGAKVEILVERIYSKDCILAHTRASRSPKPGSVIVVGDYRFEVTDRRDDLFVLSLTGTDESVFDVLDKIGHVPLPPYINSHQTRMTIRRYTERSPVPLLRRLQVFTLTKTLLKRSEKKA